MTTSDAKPRIESPTDAERRWLQLNLRVASSFVATYDSSEGAGLPEPAALDRAWSRWVPEWDASPTNSRHDPNDIINAVGVALGDHLVGALGLAWVVVTDEHGTELAVHGEPNNVLIFPPNLIAKRFVKRETDFIESIFRQIVAEVRRIRG